MENYLVLAVFVYLFYRIVHLRFENEIRYRYWLITTEKRHRNDKLLNGYPRDWQFRRIAVYKRDNGRCSDCGRKVGQLRWWTEKK